MTAPASHGYPDWGRFAATADKIYVDLNGEVLLFASEWALGHVGDQESLTIQLTALLGNVRLEVSFYADLPGVQLVSQLSADLLGGDAFRRTIPVAGAFAIVRLSASAYPATIDLRVGTASVADAHGTDVFFRQHLITGLGIAVGAGAVNTQNASHVWPGPAFWAVQASPATWSAYLVSVDVNGVQRMIDAFVSGVAERGRGVILPAGHIRTVFTNTSGAAGAYDVSVMARSPIGP